MLNVLALEGLHAYTTFVFVSSCIRHVFRYGGEPKVRSS